MLNNISCPFQPSPSCVIRFFVLWEQPMILVLIHKCAKDMSIKRDYTNGRTIPLTSLRTIF